MKKTNVMRMLDKEHIAYETKSYAYDESDLSGVHAAEALGYPVDMVFKTLVGNGDKTGFIVCCIPCHQELDLKKIAQASGNKSVHLLHVKELLPITGYIRGGCSPIGMKKKFPTFIDSSALDQEKISISAGQRGQQVVLPPQILIDYVRAVCCPLTHE